MKRLKKISIIFLVVISILIFRSHIYRIIVKYESIGQRENYYPKNGKLIYRITRNQENKDSMDVSDIIAASLIITSKSLEFTSEECEIDPNVVIETKRTNCIGYSAFFATTCNLLLFKHNKSDNWKAISQKGQLYFLGENVHTHLKNSFLKDHDFVIIRNIESGTEVAVDPSLHDYFGTKFVCLKN